MKKIAIRQKLKNAAQTGVACALVIVLAMPALAWYFGRKHFNPAKWGKWIHERLH